MDTLHERLAELADDAPTGGAPPAELWARGKRAQRLRAAAVAVTVLVVGAVGTGVGMRLADGGGDDSVPEPAGPVDVSLPIEYPAGRALPDLGDAPGALAAIWVAPRAGGGAPEVVGLIAETETFGTLPIDVSGDEYAAADPGVVLSPDGRRIAYVTSKDELVVHELVSGEKESPTIENRQLAPFAWVDATHLVGHASMPNGGWTDTGGWVWEPGTAAKLVDLGAYPGQPYLGYGSPYAGQDLMILPRGPRSCESPQLLEASTEEPNRTRFEVPVLCDVLGVVGSQILLGHWNTEHFAGESNDPKYANGTVVALDIEGADRPYLDPALRGPDADHAFEDPARRHLVVRAGAPHRVTFATDVIAESLGADGGAS
jgi:hypothetical protein